MGDKPAIPVLKPGIEIALPDQAQPEINAAAQKLYADSLPKTVQINTDRGTGSGVFMDKDGSIGTAAHVVLGSREHFATTSDGSIYKLQIVKLDTLHDTAILRPIGFTSGSRPFAEMGSSNSLLKDQAIFPMGHPGGLRPAYISPGTFDTTRSSRQILIHNSPDAEKELDDALKKLPPNEIEDVKTALARELFRGNSQIRPGDSGGPVFDANGKVVGLNDLFVESEKLTHGYFVPVEKLQELYNSKDDKFQFTYNRLAAPWAQEYKNTWMQKPLVAGAETLTAAGMAVGVGYLGYRGLSSFPKTIALSAAAIEGMRLLDDAGSLLTSTDSRDQFKFAAASAADLTGVIGGLALLSSRCRVGGAIGLSVGIVGRLAADFVPTRLILTDIQRKGNDLAPPMNPDVLKTLGL